MQRLKQDPERYAEYQRKQREYIVDWDKRNAHKRKEIAHRYRQNHLEEVRAREREAARRYTQMYPERIKAATARRVAKMMADPKAYQRHLEDQRMYRRLKLEREGMALETFRNGPRKYDRDRDREVPLKAFADWLRPVLAEKGMTAAEVAKMCEVDPTGLARIMGSRKKYIRLSVADKVLTKLDGPPLRSLYPDA